MKCWWTMLMPRAMASDGPAIWTGVAVEQDLALVGRGQPVEDVHERRLAGAVLAEQGVDLAGTDLEVDAVVGDDARVALRDAAHLERRGDDRFRRVRHGCGAPDVRRGYAERAGRWPADPFRRLGRGWLRLVDAAAGVGAGLERARPSCRRGRCRAPSGPRARTCWPRRGTARRRCRRSAALNRTSPRGRLPAGDLRMTGLRDGGLDVLLGAGDDARVGRRAERQRTGRRRRRRRRCSAAQAASRTPLPVLPATCEQDVGLVGLDEGLGEGLAAGRVVERGCGEVVRHVGRGLTLMSGLTDLAPSS